MARHIDRLRDQPVLRENLIMNDDDLLEGEVGKHLTTVSAEGDEFRQHFNQMVKRLKEGKLNVFFAPGARFDWECLHRVSHLCQFFVFVDWRFGPDDWEQAFARLRNGQTAVGGGLEASGVWPPPLGAFTCFEREFGVLASMENLPWQPNAPGTRPPEPWGRLALLRRNVGTVPRCLWLLFIGGSPLEAYERLCINHQITPKVLRLQLLQHHDGVLEEIAQERAQAWSNLIQHGGQLSQLIQRHQAGLPKLILSHGYRFDWPHSCGLQEFPDAHGLPAAVLLAQPGLRWPDLRPTAEPGRRRVRITQRPLNPTAAENVDAVLVSPRTYRRYTWPDHVRGIINQAPQEAEHVIPDCPTVVTRQIMGKPMKEALKIMDTVCAERSIERVAVEPPLGYEDEVDDLALWRMNDGPVKEMTIHARSDGLFWNLAAVSDEID